MSKKSLIYRNEKRIKLFKKFNTIRKKLKKTILSKNTSRKEFIKAQEKLFNLPLNSSPVRITNRCKITGRSRSYLRRFGVSRITFRELAINGKIPGVTKSSW
jgi:small subunit ribosomal protein S14